MVRRATLDSTTDQVKSAASKVASRSRRAADQGARTVRKAGETSRSVFDELAEAAERRVGEGEREAQRIGRLVLREVSARPGVTLGVVAAAAMLGGTLLGWALSRRG